MILGFTGTKEPITDAQSLTLFKLLIERRRNIEAAHHGDCINADAVFHLLCCVTSIHQIVIHPPEKKQYRAFCNMSSFMRTKLKVMPPLPYLIRNKNIAKECSSLVAVPKNYKYEIRSGTWSTVRYAFQSNKLVEIIWPDGSLETYRSLNDLILRDN